tara:strand:- start:974 stop:1903 length:930 start_codon:yes stop_codon:yes gene_type:complete
MATKSKKNETQTSNANDPSVIKFSNKWWVTLQGMKKKDLWAVLQDLQKTLKEQGVIKSIPSKEEDEKLYKSLTGKDMVNSIMMSAQQEMNALVMTVSLEGLTGTKKETVEDKNAEYDAILNEDEPKKVEVVSTNPRKNGPVTKEVKKVLEEEQVKKFQEEADKNWGKDGPLTKAMNDANALLSQGPIDRTGLNKNGTKSKKKVGVIASIADILIATTKPLTKDEILNQLCKRFPDRDSQAMETTVSVQVPVRMSREKNMDIVKVDCGKDAISNRTRWGYMVNCDSLECVDEVNGYYDFKSVVEAGKALQ